VQIHNQKTLPFTLKSILRQKKSYGHSNISPCKNFILKKNPLKETKNPSRCHNSITNLKFQHKQKYQSFKNPHIKTVLLLPGSQNPIKLPYSLMNLNTKILALVGKANKPLNPDAAKVLWYIYSYALHLLLFGRLRLRTSHYESAGSGKTWGQL